MFELCVLVVVQPETVTTFSTLVTFTSAERNILLQTLELLNPFKNQPDNVKSVCCQAIKQSYFSLSARKVFHFDSIKLSPVISRMVFTLL